MQILSKENAYLIKRVNKILADNGSPNYVTTSAEVIDLSQDDVFHIELKYILIEPRQKVTNVFATSAKVAKAYFYTNQNKVLEDLNENFFIEVLLHTEFNTKPVK